LRFNADSFLGASHQTQSIFLTTLAMPQSFDDVLGIIVKRYKRNVDEKAFLKDQLVLIFFPSFIDFFAAINSCLFLSFFTIGHFFLQLD
jgi:hypothetical protein